MQSVVLDIFEVLVLPYFCGPLPVMGIFSLYRSGSHARNAGVRLHGTTLWCSMTKKSIWKSNSFTAPSVGISSLEGTASKYTWWHIMCRRYLPRRDLHNTLTYLRTRQNGCHFDFFFQVHLLEWNCLNFDKNFIEVCFEGSDWQYGSGNCLALVRHWFMFRFALVVPRCPMSEKGRLTSSLIHSLVYRYICVTWPLWVQLTAWLHWFR